MTALEALERERCSAILRTHLPDAVAPAMQAAVDGGFRVIEFTLNTPNALEHIADFAKRDDLTVGAGTVLSLDNAQSAVDAGARFLVAPATDPEVIAWCRTNGIVSIPGAMTPTEMLCAHRAGADLIKLFPGPADGPNFVRACLGPLPFLRIFPTSGATIENTPEYFAAGAFGVGFVNDLFDRDDLANGRFDAIRERAERMVRTVRVATAGADS